MVTVLRLGHRPLRDKRITTHIVLVARAFGVDNVVITTVDKELERRIEQVKSKFGGSDFTVETGVDWRKYLDAWQGYIVHLTMYGLHIDDALPLIPKDANLLVVVGAEKVPKEIYDRADINVAIGNQPHSEVGALAVFLDRYTSGRALHTKFKDAKYAIIPSRRGKKIEPVYPSEKKCIKFLEEAGCAADVIAHSIAVKKLAVKLAKLCNADVKLVTAGALLHDIGRAKTHGVQHGIESAKILRKFCMPKELARIAERHVGAGILAKEAKAVGLPPKDYVPVTLEEKIVCHADSLIAGTKKQKLAAAAAALKKEGLIDAVKRLQDLHDELSAICGCNLDEITISDGDKRCASKSTEAKCTGNCLTSE